MTNTPVSAADARKPVLPHSAPAPVASNLGDHKPADKPAVAK